MPSFSVKQISIIIKMAAAKAGTDLSRSGLLELEMKINDGYKPEETEINQRYLDEHVVKPIERASDPNSSTISLGKDKVDKLCNYLGYENFKDFNEWLLKVEKSIVLYPTNQVVDDFIHIICNPEDEKFINPQVKNSLYQGQEPELKFELIDCKGGCNFRKIVKGKKCLLILNQEFFISSFYDQLKVFYELDKDINALVIPLWYDADIDELKSVFPELPQEQIITTEHLALAMQYILTINKVGAKITENSTSKNHTVIENSGAVFLGKNTTVKGKYISSRDMTININNKGNQV
ncbi:hypothetical protein GC194_04450 [bacterium]|nr:hypothetical protein [bacterium]